MIERERERERKRSLPHCNRREAKKGRKRSSSLCSPIVVFLSHSVFCSLWAAVVFPTIVGFSTLTSVYSSFAYFIFLFSVHNPTARLWPSKVKRIESYQKVGAPPIKIKVLMKRHQLMKWKGGSALFKAQTLKTRRRAHILIITYSMHARESRNDGSRKMDLQKARTCEGITFREFSLWQARKNRRTLRRTELSPNTDQHTDEEYTGPMALSEEAKQWLTVENQAQMWSTMWTHLESE